MTTDLTFLSEVTSAEALPFLITGSLISPTEPTCPLSLLLENRNRWLSLESRREEKRTQHGAEKEPELAEQ